MTPARPTVDVDGLADVMAEVQRAQKPRLSSCCYEVGTSRCRCEPMCHIPARRIVDLLAHLAAVTAERDEARAAVERVRALAESLTWVRPESSPCGDSAVDCCGSEASCEAMQPSVKVVGATAILAALDPAPTSEEQAGCGVCLTCDPPKNGAFGFPPMSRMYVCGTCGNKRCPAAGDCRKWECSGSNDPDQTPIPKTATPERTTRDDH